MTGFEGWLAEWTLPTNAAALLLAGVTLWYTFETQKLRRMAAEQVRISQNSFNAQFIPYILTGYRARFVDGDSQFEVLANKASGQAARTIAIKMVGKSDYRIDKSSLVEVTAMTSHFASHVLVVVVDEGTRRARFSPYAVEVIAPNETVYFALTTDNYSISSVAEVIEELYEGRGAYLSEDLKKIADRDDRSWIIPIFFDLSGQLYATPRPFRQQNGKIVYDKSDFLKSPELAKPDFIPVFESNAKTLARASKKRRPFSW